MNDNFDYRAYLKSNRLQSLDTQKVKKIIKENLDPKDGEVNEILKSKIKEHISSFFEAKKKEKEPEEEIDLGDEEIGDEIPAEDIEGDVAPEEGGEGGAPEGLTADEKAIQDSLKLAYDNAVQIGDDKLSKQIGNTITMFTRSHVVGAGGMMESEEDDMGYNYTHPNLDKFKPQIADILSELEFLNDEMEVEGPVDEDLVDAIEALQKILLK